MFQAFEKGRYLGRLDLTVNPGADLPQDAAKS
jgi:hypothetical protein